MKKNTSIKSIALKALILENSLQDMESMVAQLSKVGYQLDVTHAENKDQFTEALEKNRYDIILANFKLPGFDAFGALEISQEFCPEVPLICVSGYIGEDTVVELLKKGAVDYVMKDRPDRLPHAVQYAIEKAKEKAASIKAALELKDNYNLIRIAGEKAKLGGWSVNLKENSCYWSDEVAAIHETPAGYSPPVEEAIQFYAPEWRDKITEVFSQCAQNGIPYDEEMEIITATGKRVWVRTIGEAVHDKNGKIYKVQGAFQDISTRKHTEDIIKQGKQLLNTFFKQSLTGFFIMMMDKPIIWNETVDKEKVLDYVFEHQHFVQVNKAMADQYLTDAADFLNKTPNDLFAHDLKQGRKAWKELFDKGSLHVITKEQRSDGSFLWVEGDYICIYDSDGRISGYFGNQQDITEQKLAKEELEKSYLNIQMLIDLAADAFFQGDGNGNFIMANKAAAKLTGYSLNEIKSMSISDIFSKTQLHEKPLRYDLLNAGQSLTIEREITRKDGSTVPVEMNSTKMLDGTYQSFFRDITERKQAETELIIAKNIAEENEIRYRALHNASFGGIGIHDKGIILECNQGLSEITGYSVDELIGMDGLLLISEKTRAMVKANIAAAFKKPYEAIGVRKNGQEYPLRLEARNIPYRGKQVRVTKFRDITEQKRANEKIKESEIRYRTVVSNSPIVSFVLNPDGIFTLSEGKGLEKLGLKTGQVVGLSAFDVYKDFPVIIDDIKKALAGNVSRSETVMPGVVFDALYNPVFDNKGNLLEVVGVANDITERKKADIQIEKHKSELEEYFENDISADYLVSVSGEIFSCNRTFLNLFGFEEKSETEKFDITELYKNPEDRKQLIRLVKKQGKVENHEVVFISKEGKTIHALINAIGIFGKDDKLEKIRGYIVDISKQKNIERQLHKSEEKYRLLFYNNPQPMWIYDLETLAFLEVNQAAIKHYGYSKEEFLSMTLKDICPAENIPILLEEIKKTHLTLNPAGEWKHLKKNGELIDVEITSHSLFFNDRKARHILINDITQRKFFESELHKLFHAVEQSPASVIITDLDGNIEYVNPKNLEVTGYTKEELIGHNPRILSSGEKPKEEYKQLWNTISVGKEWFGEFHNKKKNGELYWESASISPILNEKGEIVNYVAIKEDITEQKRFEDTRKILLEISQLVTKNNSLTDFLAEVHKKLKKIIRADNFYVALYNETDHTFTFPYHVDKFDKLEINKPYSFSNGFTDYVLKTNKSLIVTPEYEEEIEKKGIVKVYGDEMSVWLGVPFKTKEDQPPNGVFAIQDYANVESYTEIDRSIMEIIALNIGYFIERIQYVEELIKAKEKAEESDRLKTAFLANMSHEIRTPMNGILGFTELLLEPDLSSEEKEDYIKIVQQSGQRMLSTVNDIVEISKIEAGLVQLNLTETDVIARLEELFHFFQPEAEKKGIKLSLEMRLPQENKNISTDQNKLDSILTNLVKNAIKYTETGTIKMGCKTVETPNSFGDFASIQFYVKDTGIGIPKDRQQAVFNRFIQADIADKMAFQGSGLGLAISKSYVEMLGGEIWVESLAGKGSTFYFTLPLTNQEQEKSNTMNVLYVDNERDKRTKDIHKLKILIAEDDQASWNYISIVVKDFSAEILLAETGIETVELCRKHKDLDLILMDIRMPEMGGYEATRQIREFNKDVIIIAQTAYAISGDREKAIDAGCNDYIAKPIKRLELLEKIHKYFKKKI